MRSSRHLPDASFRDGKKASKMAKKAIELAGKELAWEKQPISMWSETSIAKRPNKQSQ